MRVSRGTRQTSAGVRGGLGLAMMAHGGAVVGATRARGGRARWWQQQPNCLEVIAWEAVEEGWSKGHGGQQRRCGLDVHGGQRSPAGDSVLASMARLRGQGLRRHGGEQQGDGKVQRRGRTAREAAGEVEEETREEARPPGRFWPRWCKALAGSVAAARARVLAHRGCGGAGQRRACARWRATAREVGGGAGWRP